MKRGIDPKLALLVLAAAAALLLVGVGRGPAAMAEEGVAQGKELFLAQKCNMCHSVPGAEIEAKAKSPSMQGPNLPTERAGEVEVSDLIEYIRKNAQLDGKDHKKAAKATDEELKAIIDWLKEVKGNS